MQIGEVLAATARALPAADARREAALLLRQVLGVSEAWLLAHAQDELDAGARAGFDALLARRVAGEPVAYLLGTRGFHALELDVTPAVLIPRPETELLVELALQRIDPATRLRIADLGTGSGAIALAIAKARPHAHVVATDASAAALAVAQRNALRNGVTNVAFAQGNWCAALAAARFDLIVANPPYIALGDPHLDQGDLRFEPALALASGSDGLDAIRVIAGAARAHLQSGGWLLMEHGYEQGAAVRELLLAQACVDVFTAPDLEGRDRVSGARMV